MLVFFLFLFSLFFVCVIVLNDANGFKAKKKQGARIHLNIVEGNVAEPQSEVQTVAEESEDEESSSEDESAKIPADAVFPDVPELSNAPKHSPPTWDP